MAEDLINIVVNNEIFSIAPNTTVKEVLHAENNLDIVGGLIGGGIVGLDMPLAVPVNLSPVHRNTREGHQIINRTSSFLLEYIMASRFPKYHFQVGQSLNQGYYYELLNIAEFPDIDLEALADEIDKAVNEAIEADIHIDSHFYNVETACVLLKDNRGAMIKLLNAWPYNSVPLAKIDSFYAIQYGVMAPSAKYCKGIKIIPFEGGFILQFRKQVKPSGNYHLMKTFRENRAWNKMIGVATVGDLNESILNGHISDIIRMQEGLHEKKIIQIADTIAANRDKLRLICIAGPSSSSKTTFLKRLSVQLSTAGIQPVTISLDDYYADRSLMTPEQRNNLDLESLEALDVDLLREHLQKLVDGERILAPHFDFSTGTRVAPEKFTPHQLLPNQMLLIEGIHGLNPAIADSVPEESRFRIFVSSLTQLVIDEHTRIPTSDTRLLRRIVRDRRYRGTSAAKTIAMWPKVRRGEINYIFPFQEHCDVMFNSSLVYETAVLKTFAWRYLLEVPQNDPARVQAQALLRFLDLFVPIFPDDIPTNSLLREFIGGSSFNY